MSRDLFGKVNPITERAANAIAKIADLIGVGFSCGPEEWISNIATGGSYTARSLSHPIIALAPDARDGTPAGR
jgi:hypothetical protein